MIKKQHCANSISIFLLLVALITIYNLPLLLNLDKAFFPVQKNYINTTYFTYFFAYFYHYSITLSHHFPFWCSFYEGGSPWISHPADISLNPFSLVLLVFGVIKGLNLASYLFSVIGAGSMYVLMRKVFRLPKFGAVYSAIVFSMSGFFAYMQANGYLYARDTLLLPLLMISFLKSRNDKRFIFVSAYFLAFLFMQSCLYFPVIVLFLFFIVMSDSFMINKKTICFDKKYFIVFGVTITLALLYSMPKLLPLLNDLNIQTVAEKFDYTMRISQANTFPLLLKHILKPVDSSAGTMFMGVLPLFLCTVSIVILFSRLKKWIFVLAVFIWLSLGPNAIIDLHYIFWHLPIFKSIREISKYYALILVFLISLISGHFFIILKNNASSKKYHIISLVIIVLTYLNLCWANAGYFNVYKQKITDKFSLKNVTYVKAMNMHLADDSSILPLRLALFFKGYGIVGAKVWDPYLDFSSNIIPEYFVLTQYAFLSPSTKAIFIKNPGYKGEVWFLDDANIVKAYSNYQSKIEVQVVVNKPGGMFINQSYSHRWSVNEGEIFNRDNRLFIVLDRVGQYKIVLRYIPIYFYAGLFICFVSVFGSIFIFFKISKRKVSA